MEGVIFDIQGYSVHDGSGCRTLVFLSGCPLRCAWCSNPEGQLLRPRVMYRENKCSHAHYRCVKACPHNAIQIRDLVITQNVVSPQLVEAAPRTSSGVRRDLGNHQKDGASPPLQFDRSICDRCDSRACVQACLSEALKIAGRPVTVEELMRTLVRDQGFWGSEGGVTFGGGEPLFQAEFLLALLSQCRSNYMHTAVETSAHADTGVLMEVLQWADAVFVDVKHMDSAAHRAGTGAGNELILHNIEAAAHARWDGRLIIRVPLVPGYNDTPEDLQATAAFVARLGLQEVNLLPFHRLAHSKYQQLGLNYPYAQVPSLSGEALRSCQRIFETAGLQCYVGSETPF